MDSQRKKDMSKDNSTDYQYERYKGDMFLDMYTHDLYNNFDASADEQIRKLEEKRSAINCKFDNTTNSSEDVSTDFFYKMLENSYVDEEIIAIYEMKIIYAYKLFELKVKRLLNIFYPNEASRGLYKWENLKSFFKNKGVFLNKLNGYSDLNDLRVVNNNLKHSSEVDNEILRIKEFSKAVDYDIEELKTFYERVKKSPIQFLQVIADAINEERFVFDNDKIEAIAHDLAKRMELKDVNLLFQKLKSKY